MCAFAGRFHLHVLHELAPESRKSNLIKVPPVLFMALQRWGGSRKHFCSNASSCSFFSNHHYFLTIWGEVWRNDAHSACVLHIREWVCVCVRAHLFVCLPACAFMWVRVCRHIREKECVFVRTRACTRPYLHLTVCDMRLWLCACLPAFACVKESEGKKKDMEGERARVRMTVIN